MQFSTFVLTALSMGSAIASPVNTGYAGFNTAAIAIANVNVIVQQEAININTITSGSAKADTVAKVQKSLLTVGQSINSLIGPVIALGNARSSSLNKEQIADLPKFQNDYQKILVSLEGIGKRVTGSNLDKAAIAQIKPELQWVLASPGPIARPIIAFVEVAAPKYATYSYWTPYFINIEAIIVVALAPIALGLGLDISIL
ncbi:hypothetical protein F4824DRAFT_517896 [Ustulina deusta]|nr:hypothetical protein F4824DRAFT_517896 [Ustulina deusta]